MCLRKYQFGDKSTFGSRSTRKIFFVYIQQGPITHVLIIKFHTFLFFYKSVDFVRELGNEYWVLNICKQRDLNDSNSASLVR